MIMLKENRIARLRKILIISFIGFVLALIYIKIKIELEKPITKKIFKNKTNNISRLQYIILDGLRYDIFTSTFSHLKLPINSAYYESITETPTITVPRLITMFSGRKSKIIDCLNMSRHIKEETDSIFDQISCNLFGDSTLNDLFGVKTILENEPYFPNIKKEIEILEYLIDTKGPNRIIHLNVLDKVGHEYGVYSKEYTNILKIYIDFLNKYIAANPESLIVITSDHGCLDNGNHGGNSKEERSSIFCIIDKNIDFKKWPINGKEIQQIDILPTLCDILKIDYPSNSRGTSLIEVEQISE